MENVQNEESDRIKVKLLFFAESRELTGKKETQLFLMSEINTGSKLRNTVFNKFPCLLPLQDSIIIALNEKYLIDKDNFQLSNGDEIAVLPPLSGG